MGRVSVTEWIVVALVALVFIAIALDLREMRLAKRRGSRERRRFGLVFYIAAALLLLWLIITGNGAMILNPNAPLK